MAWYDQAVFYHIYPLGLTGAPKQNPYGEPVHRLNTLLPWIEHIRRIGCNALYIGPLFESVGHGYETTDYFKLDSRLGTNDDLRDFVAECHRQGIRVILDGVFNHVGRDFFAFRDLKQNRENSQYRDWFCNVNFWNNNEYNDGFSYDNWGGYNLLVKLNQRHWAVRDHICSAISMWVREFDIDGLRLDAADVLDFEFMRALRQLADEIKPEFWLMGEVIHGQYDRWANRNTLHSVTDYALHKGLYSGHNEHNYFEIAHTVKRLYNDMGLNHQNSLRLYSFVDNHDVERIATKLREKEHYTPVHILLYTLPGIPSVYYGSEFGIQGKKERHSDDSLRPALNLADFADAYENNPCTRLVSVLGKARQNIPALTQGEYKELCLTTRQYAFARTLGEKTVLVAVNNDGNSADMRIPAENGREYTGLLTGEKRTARDGVLCCTIRGNSGEIWVPAGGGTLPEGEPVLRAIPQTEPAAPAAAEPERAKAPERVSAAQEAAKQEQEKKPAPPAPEKAAQAAEPAAKKTVSETPASEQEAVKLLVPVPDKPYEEMTVPELQSAVLEKLAKNGPVTDRMRRDVEENIWKNSLINWVRSFR